MGWKKISYFLFKFLEKLIQSTPFLRKFYILFLGNLIYYLDFWRKPVVKTNIKLVFPSLSNLEKEKIVRKVYINFAGNIVDFILTKKLENPNDLKKWIEVDISPSEMEKIKKGPAIFITAHFGNWELIPLAMGAFITPLTVVARKMDIPEWDKEIKQHREKFNVKIIYKKGALGKLMKELKEGRNIGMLPDQNTTKEEGVETTWFGLKVLQSPSPILLAKKLNLPIIVFFCEPNFSKKEPPWKLVCRDIYFPTKDIQKDINHISRIIEEEIKRFPFAYFWFHKRFKHFYEDEYK